MKKGILGGTFDPIHRAHLEIASCALSEYGLDEILFMPAGDPYFKEGSRVTSPSLRLEMTKACIEEAGEPRFRCSDLEILDRNRTYTSDTILKLRHLYPDDILYFILGLDSLEALHTWHAPEVLLDNAVILCAMRQKERSGTETFFHGGTGGETKEPGREEDEETRFLHAVLHLKERFPQAFPDIRQLHCPMIAMSSTLIREKAAAGEDLMPYVTPAVAHFIDEHHLYGI